MRWLDEISAPLNVVLFHLGNDAVSWAELLGFITGGACVWLTVRARMANFPVGIANSALFLVLFTSARLWADASLQLVFITLGAFGWWQWIGNARVADGRTAASGRLGPAGFREVLGCVVFTAAGTVLLTVVLRRVSDAAPFWDSLTTCLSLAAQWLLNNRKLQTWWFWIAADLIYVPLYAVKRLDLTALVYLLFLAMCVRGLRDWTIAARTERRPAAAVPTGTGS